MVIVRLIHGLGNQLFQYAMGRAVAHRSGASLRLDLAEYARDVPNRTPRQFMLDQFHITGTVATAPEVAEVRGGRKGTLRHRLQRLRDARKPYFRQRVVEERGLAFDANYRKVSAPVYLVGYWQSEAYFDDVAPLLQEELRLKDERIVASARETVARLREGSAQVVGVHVRRGDYLQPEKPQVVLPSAYFEQAMARFEEEQVVYLFFSDSAEGRAYCEEVLGKRRPFALAEGETALHDFEMLRQCDHIIIANSSFSWWAAWLNANPSKRIIAPHPRHWFKPGYVPKQQTLDHLVPEAWETLEAW